MKREKTEHTWRHLKTHTKALYNVQKFVRETDRRRKLEKAIFADKPRGDS